MFKNGPKMSGKHSESDWTSLFASRKKKTWSYHDYRAFYDKKCKKNHFFCNFSGFLGQNRRFLYYTPQLQNTRKCSKMIQKCRENIQRVTEHPLFTSWKNHGHIMNIALSMTKNVKKFTFFAFCMILKLFFCSKSKFLHYTPQLQNTEKCSKMIQKCRENIQRVTEHPLFHLVKKSWSYHQYRAFYDKKCKKNHFFRGLGGFEPDLRFRFSIYSLER